MSRDLICDVSRDLPRHVTLKEEFSHGGSRKYENVLGRRPVFDPLLAMAFNKLNS
jgi:hypothetical protein